MKDLLIRVLIGALLISSQVQATGTNCIRPIKELMSEGSAQKLKPGEKVWGDIVCRSCGEEYNTKPNADGDVRCPTCASPQTDEVAFPPAFFKSKGQIYLINRKALVGYEDGKFQGHGLRDNCPFCETGHFANANSCISCGAELLNGDDAFSGLPNLRGTTSSAAINTNQERVSRVTAETGEDLAERAGLTEERAVAQFGREAAVIKEQEEITQRIPLDRKHWIAIGATGTIFGLVGGASYYFKVTEVHVISATVTRVERNSFWVSYQFDGQRYDREFENDQGNSPQMRIGEFFTVHHMIWSGPIGAERGNGDAFAPVVD
jgi:hypothetical protein